MQAVNSILNQTLRDIEFIICDDGSTVNKEIFNHLKTIDDRIIVIKNKKNMGLAYSLNECIKISKCNYIARQDADDMSYNYRLEKQLSFLENNEKISFVGSNITLFDENGDYGSFKFKEYPKNEDFLFSSPFNHGSIMFRKKALIENNLYRVAEETRRCEDYDLFIRMYINNCKAYNIQENLYKFREDMDAKKRRKFIYRIDDMKIRAKYFKNMGFGAKRYFYIIKPILVGLLPLCVLDKLKRMYY